MGDQAKCVVEVFFVLVHGPDANVHIIANHSSCMQEFPALLKLDLQELII